MRTLVSGICRRAPALAAWAAAGVMLAAPLAAAEEEDGPVREFAERHARIRSGEERFREAHGAYRRDVFRRAAPLGLAEIRAERARRSLAPVPSWVSLGPDGAPQGGFPGAFAGALDSGLVNAIAIHPSDPRTIYVGPAGGGVWRSKDAGTTWTPLTDTIGPTPIGAIAIAPSDPRRIYAGGGSGRQSLGEYLPGPGLLVSTDGGDSWRLTATSPGGEFWFLRVDPANPRIVLAGTDKGLFRSTDGGDSWTKTLTAAGDAWANSLVASPSNPSVLLAATFRTYGTEVFRSGACVAVTGVIAPGRLWKSTDGGVTWTENGNLPGSAPPVRRSRIELAFAPSNPSVVYALIAKEHTDTDGCVDGSSLGELFDVAKSTDGGDTWTALGAAVGLTQLANRQLNYASVVSVDPRDERVVWVGGLDNFRSADGGATWKKVSAWITNSHAPFVHADQHFHFWAPDGSILYLGCDGGLFATTNDGVGYQNLNRGLVTFQFYTVCHGPAAPGVVMGGAQDNGSSVRRADGTWLQAIGGDGFGCLLHPTDPLRLLGSIYNETIYRSLDGGNTFGEVTITPKAGDTAPFETKLVQDPAVPDHVFTSTALALWESLDGGVTWKATNAALLTGIAAIRDFAVSPLDSKVIAIAANSGKTLFSADGGATFTPGGTLPVNTLSSIRFDRTNPQNLWVTSGLETPGIERAFASTDGGTTWTAISHTGKPGGLPDLPVEQVEQDPSDPNVLWAASYIGVYRSPNRGATWARYGAGLPNVPVTAIAILPDGSKIRVATYGRGMWEIALAPLPPDQPPTAAIDVPATTPTLDAGIPMTFHGVAADPDAGDVLTLAWDFGDGTSAAAGASAAHAFAVPGTYLVTFRVTDFAGLSATATRSVNARVPQGSVASGPELLLPVVLDVVGAGGAHYTTELTLLSRAASPTTVLLQYTSSAGGGSGYASVALAPGEVRVIPDTIAFLRGAGLPLPADGTRIGTLRAVYPGAAASEVFIGGRTSTPGAGGTFGLFYTGTATSTTSATVFGLQQNAAQRSNLALVNAGPDSVTLRVALQGPNGEALAAPADQTLAGFGWTQLNTPLAGLASSGRAVVTRVSGSSPFATYGVLNDAVTSDGSFVPALVPGDASGADRLVLIVLSASGYRSELTLANLTSQPMPLTLAYTGSPQLSAAGTGTANIVLAAGEQRIQSDAMAFLRNLGLPVPSSGNVGGALLVKAPPGTPASAFAAGARTFTDAAGGGTFGLFYPGLTAGECATALAWVNGLQQNAVQRSNLAIVNRGDAADAVTLRVTYFGADGSPLASPDVATLAPGEWRQFNQPLASRGAAAGFAKIERISGVSRWAAYGVLNDQHNSDGSYVPMSR